MRAIATFALTLPAALFCCGMIIPAHAQSMNVPGNPCEGRVATSDVSACFEQALAAADHDLTNLYARIKKVLVNADELKALTEAERLWVQYRDATCNAEYALYGGGTGGAPTRLACLTAETRAREASLTRSFGWRLDKFGG